MELPKRKNSRLCDYDYSLNGAYFITICTKERKKILSKITVGTPLPGCPQEVRSTLMWHGKVAEAYIRQMDAFYGHLSVVKYVIMPDHIHFLLLIQGDPGMGDPTTQERTSKIAQFVGTFKRFCNKVYGENIWQSRYYDHVIRNQQDYDEIWKYIENNPVKWAMEKHGME